MGAPASHLQLVGSPMVSYICPVGSSLTLSLKEQLTGMRFVLSSAWSLDISRF